MSIKRFNSGVGLIYVLVVLFFISLIFAILRALLPLLIVVGAAGGLWWFWNRNQMQKRQQQRFLNSVFNQILTENQGRVTVFDFAMKTDLKPLHARQFLDEWAKECSAHFDVTEEGNIVYYFPMDKSSFPFQNEQ
ncbi:hypothetical protein Cri9333_4051 [Crinalium epipsammum PCC 9333]|uniref:Uncharacterized protein n=1 Tax=Crinalium epipsammum PCC 9333 TaxID=1173022 RepID=K9W3S3_9CYAN|nr:hypothetical protein [Crinalium epipsammum]AFZ14856.1 hypothetical protein Cri9333_4051 [Crinalium epipsammum PCC 9333]